MPSQSSFKNLTPIDEDNNLAGALVSSAQDDNYNLQEVENVERDLA